MTETAPSGTQDHATGELSRSLGMWAIVALGLGYMTPTVIFDTFGIVSEQTNGVVPTAYVLALVAMFFTAISYGRMTRVFPSAGSAYTYTSRTISPHLGFLIGWSSLLDYLLLPLVNALIIRSYMEAFFPDVPPWLWVAVYVAAVTALVLVSMSNTSRVNGLLVAFSIVLIVVFVTLAWRALAAGDGNGTVFSTAPAWHGDVHLGLVVTGATMVCFSFIGFDAITMYTEEAKDASTVPKAIVLTLLIGGGIFFVAAWFTQSLFPSVADFSQDSLENSALPEIAFLVGGQVFKILLTAAAFAATAASGLASHASVSRLLYVMARDGSGPLSRVLGWVHPGFRTPAYAVLFVGIVSLGAIPFNLDFIAALINFGALIAFSFVNITVIAWFAVRQGARRTLRDLAVNLALPLVGVAFTLILWLNLSPESRNYGLIWFGVGIAVLVWLTRFFQRPLTINLGEEPTDELDRHPATPGGIG